MNSSNHNKKDRHNLSEEDDDDEALFRRIQRVSSAGTNDVDGNDDGSRGGRVGDVTTTTTMSEDLTLRQVAALACKRIDIGTAVLPKPLFVPDVEDAIMPDTTSNSRKQQQQHSPPDGYTTDDFYMSVVHYHHQNEQQQQPNDEPASTASTSTIYADMIQNEFNAVVIEHHLKWAPLVHSEPGPLEYGQPSNRFGRYDFYHADAIVDWCLSHNITKIKGHVLVWHVTTPKFVEQMSSSELRQQLKRHIYTTMGHFKGRITTWDVVNEALAPDGSLAETIFYTKLGPQYIEDCFRWAHDADPTATLLYNDNKVEGIDTPKADGFYNLLADLKAKHVPIHGCGMQGHFNAAGTGANRPPTPAAVKQQIHRLGQLGLSVNISEMDVRVSKLPSSQQPHLRDIAQYDIYHDILVAALSEPAFDGIWLWGFTDRHTWVHSFYYDDEPCILDESYQRKRAYYAVRSALQSITPGHVVGGCGPNHNQCIWLSSDIDAEHGTPWGHVWMQPESDDESTLINGSAAAGDARPDWELPQQPQPAVKDYDESGDEADVDDDDDDGHLERVLSTDSDYIPPLL